MLAVWAGTGTACSRGSSTARSASGPPAPLRDRVCAGLTGEVVEIGFGSGGNVPHYPAAVRGVAAVEPSDLAWQLAERRLRAATVPVRRSGVDGQSTVRFGRCVRQRAVQLDACAPSRTRPRRWPRCTGC